MQQSDFLELVFGDQQGYVVTQPRAAHHGVWRKWPSTFTTDDQYFSPIVYSGEQRTKDDTAATSLVIYVDADRTDLDEFFTWTPSIRVTTSEGSHHLYWVLDAPVPMKDAAALSQRIGRAHKMEPSAGIAAKLLRLPGTLNTSSEKIQGSDAFPVTAESTGLIYSYAELSAGYPEDGHDFDLVRPDLGMPDTWPNHFDVLDRVDGQSRLNLLLEAEFNTEDIDWSNKRYEALNLALEDGFSPAEATVLVWNSPLSDSKREQGIEHVWKYDTSKAVANQAAKDDPTLAVPVDAPTDIPPLLAENEKAYVSGTRTFVDSWADAAYDIVHRKTPRQYLEMGAFSLYSALLSAHVGGWMPKGEVQLVNLYVLNAGSQNTSKSQSMNYQMKFLRHWDDTTGSTIDTGSTFTFSGLIKGLREKDNQAAFLHTDEAALIFKQWQTEAFSGAKDLFLQLYTTPWLPKHLLAGKDAGNTETVRVYFSATFAGTPDETFSAMSKKMLRDGTTARMLPVMANTVEQEFEDKLAYSGNKGDDEDEVTEDTRYADFAETMSRLIRWTQRTNSDPGMFRLAFTPDAKLRHAQFGWDLEMQARAHKDPDAANAHARRLGVNVWKLACLIAVERYSDWIEMSDLAHALAYGERAWGWMLEVLERVADNEYTRLLDETQKWLITRGGKAPSTLLFAKSPLSTLAPKEAIDAINGLSARGIIKPWINGSSRSIELIAKD